MNKIGIIICFLGEWPMWLPFFLESCAFNQSIDWLFFSDHKIPGCTNKNINYQLLTKDKFNKLATEKLELRTSVNDPYKLCDFKPAYGKIFEDYLKEYNFWGYSDIDLIYGNISDFITPDILLQYDIISTYSGFISGPLTIYRNRNDINKLFMQAVNYSDVYQNSCHFGFDENIRHKKTCGTFIQEKVLMVSFLYHYLKIFHFKFVKMKELKYQFQWYYKRNSIKQGNLFDMTDVILYSVKKGKIKAYFKEIMLSDRHFERTRNNNWFFSWRNGILVNKDSGEKIMAFHFIDQKKLQSFSVPPEILTGVPFSITKKGFKYE